MKKYHFGDKGKTLFGGRIEEKDSLIIEVIGELDELNSFIGLIRENLEFKDLDEILEKIQNHIFQIGSCLHLSKQEFSEDNVKFLESLIEKYEKELKELKHFIYPIGKLHYCRALARRVERRMFSLSKQIKVDKNILVYLNRLSDLLFVLARIYNKRKNLEEKEWKL